MRSAPSSQRVRVGNALRRTRNAGQRRSGPRWEARTAPFGPKRARAQELQIQAVRVCRVSRGGAQTFAIDALESGGRDAAPRRILSHHMRPVRCGGEAACLDRAMGWVLAPLRNADRADRWAGERARKLVAGPIWAGPVRGADGARGKAPRPHSAPAAADFPGRGWCCITLGGLPAFCERLPQVELRRAHHRFANRLRAGARSLRRAWDRRLVRDRWHARLAGHSQRFRQREAGRVRPP